MPPFKGLNPDWMDFSSRIPQAKTGHITRQSRNVPYGEAQLQQLDIYLPEEGSGPFPVIVNVHGGGLTTCDKHDFHLYPTMYALQQGFAVAAVNYRLSPAVRYPEHYFDLKRALLWLAQNGAGKNLDMNNVFLWGTSAGGNLVLQAGCKCGIPLPAELLAANDVRINAVAAMCPAIDFTQVGNYGTIFERLLTKLLFFNLNKHVFGSNKVPEAAARQSNPTTYIDKGIVPVYLQQGTRDPAVPFPQVEAFKAACQYSSTQRPHLRRAGGGSACRRK
ncbi:MAG: alpha/beta hydrolase [Chloroflexota bacterium]|nr:MAG: alpha/beta hydrolase [Chloroflexota bacterium]